MFKQVSEEFVRDIVNGLSSNKAATGKILLKIIQIILNYTNYINEAMKNNKFPLKLNLSLKIGSLK